MPTIFNISQALDEVFEQIEENNGELTPELEKRLQVNSSNFNSKLESYCDVINKITNEIDTIKKETDRLKALQKSKENTIKSIKQLMNYFIEKYVEPDKKGKRALSLNRYNIRISKTQSVKANDAFLNDLSKYILQKIYLYQYNNLEGQEILNKDSILDYCKHKLNVDITSDDIDNINVNINTKINIDDMLKHSDGINMLRELLVLDNSAELKPSVDKTAIKEKAKNGEYIPFFTQIETNNSVIIK